MSTELLKYGHLIYAFRRIRSFPLPLPCSYPGRTFSQRIARNEVRISDLSWLLNSVERLIISLVLEMEESSRCQFVFQFALVMIRAVRDALCSRFPYSRSLPPFRNANPRASAPSAPLTRFPRPSPPPVRPNDPRSLLTAPAPKFRASDPNRAVAVATAAISREAGRRHRLRRNARSSRDSARPTPRADRLFATPAGRVPTGHGAPSPFMVIGGWGCGRSAGSLPIPIARRLMDRVRFWMTLGLRPGRVGAGRGDWADVVASVVVGRRQLDHASHDLFPSWGRGV